MCAVHTCFVFMDVCVVLFLFCLPICLCVRLQVQRSEHTTQRNAEVKSIINKDRQVAPKRMPLVARLAVNTHNVGWRFVESVKNARWSMSPQEAGDGLESIVEFQVQIKGHNHREYEDKWQGWQNWTDEKLVTKPTKDDQQPVLLLPARWWPATLQEFESGGWWQRPHKRVRCRQPGSVNVA